MNDTWFWWTISAGGFALSSVGGLGHELLDSFAGRRLEAYSRLKQNRERFGEVLQAQDDVVEASAYVRVIGTVIFLIAGTGGIFIGRGDPTTFQLSSWGLIAGLLMMMVHLWLPSAVTRFASAPLLYRTWPFWRWLTHFMRPLFAPGDMVETITRRVTGTETSEKEEEEALEDEIHTIVELGTREGYFGPGVREMIRGVVSLSDRNITHIMTPRSDVDAIELSWCWSKILETIVRAGRTRFPVYRETLDDIVGILYVKDLLPHLADEEIESQDLNVLMRHSWTVSDTRSVESLLREFLHNRSHMAIVVDEFSRTAGVVTIEDALEEIVGEIVDESDDEEEVSIKVLDRDTVEVDGRVMVDDLNEEMNWSLPEAEDYETIAGYVLFHNGAIPEAGQCLTFGENQIEILRATNRKIESMRIRRLESGGHLAS
ncbi:MAG: hemolysin family protein [Planctomycetota bacterium]